MITIPTDTVQPFYYQTTTLEGVAYLLEFRYNQRESCYYLKISLSDQTVLAQGIKLVPQYRLLQAYADSRMPPGELVVVLSGSSPNPPALGELGAGQRCELVYYTRDEVVAAGQDAWRL